MKAGIAADEVPMTQSPFGSELSAPRALSRDALLSELRTSPSSAALLAALSSLIVLRWADQQDAVLALDGAPAEVQLVPGSRWRDWCELSGERLHHTLMRNVLPGIETTRDVGIGALVRHVYPFIAEVARLDGRVRDVLVSFVRALPLATPADREDALVLFEGIVEHGTALRAGAIGEFVTPREIVDLVVELASPRPGERIYDPCFGVGAVLSGCARRVHARSEAGAHERSTTGARATFFGVEHNRTAFVIGLCRMILTGIDQPILGCGDVFAQRPPIDRGAEGFDLVVIDPPFGERLPIDAAAQFTVKATSAEALFLQHAMASLRPGGRAVVVLSRGALFRPGTDAAVRRLLLETHRVDGIVLLPPGAYALLGKTQTSVIVFRREPPASSVRFVEVGRRSLEMGSPELDATVVAAAFRGESGLHDVTDVPVEDLVGRDATFLPARHDAPLSVFVQAVRAADTNVPVRRLVDVAEIFAGISYSAKELLAGRYNPGAVGLLRVTEVKDGDTLPPVRFLTPEAARAASPDRHLRAGDVTLTRSGTIGRAAVIANGAVGCVAASGLAVLRTSPEILSPHYLAALLNSGPIRAWAAERARGVTIQHLSLAELRALEIPLLDIAVQVSIAREHRATGTDASVLVLRALSHDDDPIASWLESSSAVQRLLAVLHDPTEGSVLGALDAIALEFRDARSRVTHVSRGASPPELVGWMGRLADGIATVAGVGAVPIGTGRLAILDAVRRAADDAVSGLRNSALPASVIAREVTEAIAALLVMEAERCLSSFRLIPSVEPATLAAGSTADLIVTVRNEGAIALRNMRLRALDGEARSPYLDTGQIVSITNSVRVPLEAGSWSFRVGWEAQRLDGHNVEGDFPLAIEVRAPSRAGPTADLGTSPYIVGVPVNRVEMLFGRDKILDNIKRQLGTDRRANIVLLEGNRRTGKTSILKRLEASGELPGWISVNHSLQGAEGDEHRAGVSTKEIFRRLAHDLGVAVGKVQGAGWPTDFPRPDASMGARRRYSRAVIEYFEDDHPFEAFEIFVQSMLEAAAPRRILLMLDEFDKIQEGIDTGVTSPQVPENLRYLFHTYPTLGGVLSGSRRLTKLRNEYWSALFGIGYVIRIGPLAHDDALSLVTNPVAGRLVYVPAASDLVVDLCACQPFLIQTLCNRIFEDAAERREGAVTVAAVERAGSVMAADNEHFETLWSYAKTDRRRLILALLCELGRGHEGQALDAGVLGEELDRRGITPPGDGLGEDINHLRELELVELEAHEGYQRYRLTIPLMADWIRKNKDFSDLTLKAIREAEEEAS